MTVDEVTELLGKISQHIVKHDEQNAYFEERDMLVRVLRAIAFGEAEDPAALAQEALKAEQIDFRKVFP